MDMYQVVIKPLVTEKGTMMLSEGNWVTFRVHPDANKIEVREAIQKIFSVSVLQVNTQIVRGKRRRFGKTMGQSKACLLYTSPSPRDATLSRMPSSA